MSDLQDVSEYISTEWSEPMRLTYNQRDLIIYALGIGCTDLKYVYELDGDFTPFPTFPITLSFKGDATDVVSFPNEYMMNGAAMPGLDGTKVVLDGERYIEMIQPLDPEGGELFSQQKLTGVFKRGSGASVETETRIVDKDGNLFYKIISGAFMVGAKGFKDAGKSSNEVVNPPKRAPDKEVEMPTDAFQTHTYRLSGDYNPLHIDPDFAQSSGFAKPILHGLCSLGITARAALAAYGDNDPANFKALNCRFSSPVLPGQTLVVSMWKEGNRVVLQSKVKETGKVCINNSYMDFKAGAKL